VKSASVGRTGLTPLLWPVRWGFEVDPVVLGEVLEGFVGLVLLLLLASAAVVLVEVLYHVAGALQRVVLIGDGADDYDGVEEGPDRLFDRVGRGPRRDGLLALLALLTFLWAPVQRPGAGCAVPGLGCRHRGCVPGCYRGSGCVGPGH
jgi:hypothetical protein